MRYKITVEVVDLENKGEEYYALKKVGSLKEVAAAMKEIGEQIVSTFENPTAALTK
jgi:hypothetical protein